MGKRKSVFRHKIAAWPIVFGVLVAILMLVVISRNVYAALAVISPSNMQGWVFEVQSPDGFGTFVSGPLTPPEGVGSVRLFTGTNGNLSIALHNNAYESLKLNEISRLEYSTYSVSTDAANNKFPFMYLDVSTQYGPDTLYYDPEDQTQTPQLNTWQTWNTLGGVWHSTGFVGFTGGTLSDYIVAVGNGIIVVNRVNGTGGIRMQAGPGGGGDVFDQNIDNFVIGVNGGDITYDFEPDVVPSPTPSVSPTPSPSPPSVPTNKDQCKNGGWNVFRNPTFKNQGDCVSFFNKSN